MVNRKQVCCLILLTLIFAGVFFCANNRPYQQETAGYSQSYGFPFSYRFDAVANDVNVFSDGGTLDDPREEIIWVTSYDDVGIRANVAVGVLSVLIASGLWLVVCQKLNRPF